MLKRSMDCLLSILFLTAALPIMAIAALLIKFDSPGPLLFSQLRMGRNFRPFRLVKLRTMESESAGDSITLGRDPRITRVGHWLRKLKIDELPQLWNVLLGDMSFVGPRPVILDLAHEFRPQYERLLTVRPGLTDPATLRYMNEVELLACIEEPMQYFRTVLTPHKLRLSEEYLDRANLRTDLLLILKTAKCLMQTAMGSLLGQLEPQPNRNPARSA